MTVISGRHLLFRASRISLPTKLGCFLAQGLSQTRIRCN